MPNDAEKEDEKESLEKEEKSRWRSMSDKVEEWRTKHLPLQLVKRLTKCWLAFQIALILVLIHPVSAWIGQSAYLFVTGCVFFYPARTFGAAIENTSECLLDIMSR